MSTSNFITINMGVVDSEAYVHYGDQRIRHMWEGSNVNGDKNNSEGEGEGILFGAQIRVYRRKKVERVWKGDMIQWGEDDMRYFLKRWVFRLQKKVRSNWRGKKKKKKKISLPSGKRAGMESSSVYVGWWTDCREERAELLLKKVDNCRRDVSSLKSRGVCNQGVFLCILSQNWFYHNAQLRTTTLMLSCVSPPHGLDVTWNTLLSRSSDGRKTHLRSITYSVWVLCRGQQTSRH